MRVFGPNLFEIIFAMFLSLAALLPDDPTMLSCPDTLVYLSWDQQTNFAQVGHRNSTDLYSEISRSHAIVRQRTLFYEV